MKRYISLIALVVCSASLGVIIAMGLTTLLASTDTESTNLAINFTNSGKGSAYVHWLLPPGFTTSPTAVNFGTVPLGAQSAINLELMNDGPVTIQLLPLSVSGTNAADFTFLSQCPQYLDPEVPGCTHCTCNVKVTFKPSAIGARTGVLTIPFAGLGENPPASLQIILTKVKPQPPEHLVGVVVPR